MTDDPLPPPETCAHNLYAASDASRRPEASDLCRNEIGVFHMLDCPLFLGRPCTYYEPAPEQRIAEDELALERAAQELRQDFLSWGYTRRVRALAQPRDAVPERATVEAIDEPEDRGIVVRRAGAEDEPEIVAVEEEVVAEEEPEAAPASRPELYPGQRRSEERVRGPRRARHDGEGDAGEGEEAPEEADEAEEVVEEERPRTVAELFEQLPEAHLPDRPAPSRPPSRRGRRTRRGRTGRGRPEGAPDGPAESGRPREGAAAGGDGERPPRGQSAGRRRRGRRAGRSGGDGGSGAPRPGPGSADGGGGEPTSPSGEGGGKKRPRRRRKRRGPPREGGGGGDGGS